MTHTLPILEALGTLLVPSAAVWALRNVRWYAFRRWTVRREIGFDGNVTSPVEYKALPNVHRPGRWT